jgi:5-methylthioribose kinase
VTYRSLDAAALPSWLAAVPAARDRLGGAPADWSVAEVSDGNMNRVFLCHGPRGAVAVKQALPFIRAVPAWAFPLERMDAELRATRAFAAAAPGAVPEVLHADEASKVMVMEALVAHRPWRHALVEGEVHPEVPSALGATLARLHHAHGPAALGAEAFREAAVRFGANAHLVATTAEVVFTGPLGPHPLNRWTSPQLDALVARLRADPALTTALARLKRRFLTTAETLVHGDLHTGSVMVAREPARAELAPKLIDAEWAFYGPAAFDVGVLLGHLRLAACARAGGADEVADPGGVAAFCAAAPAALWRAYRDTRLALRGDSADDPLLPHRVVADPEARRRWRLEELDELLVLAVGFAGAEMIRRLIGISHVEDFETIADAGRRAEREAAALRSAHRLVTRPRTVVADAALVPAAFAPGSTATEDA